MARHAARALWTVCFVATIGGLLAQSSDAEIKKGCGNKPADIVFVLDESGSIWGPDFKTQIVFVETLIGVFNISQAGTHIGVLTFSDSEVIHFALDEYSSKGSMISNLESIGQRRGGTRTFEAIETVRTTMFSQYHTRPNVPHICILITDGESEDTQRTADQAARLKESGVTVFAVGVGTSVNTAELQAIASEPVGEHVFKADNYDLLMTLKETLAIKTCEVTTQPPPTTTTTTTTTTTVPTTLPQMIEGCENSNPMDILYALPNSAGVFDTDLALDFISLLTQEMTLGPAHVQVGVTPRECEEADPIYLMDHDTTTGFNHALDNRRISPGTASQLKWMYQDGIDGQYGGRDEATKFGILVIDSESDDIDETINQATAAKFDMQLIVIGVGPGVNENELKAIASDENSYFTVPDYTGLNLLTGDIMDRLCDGLQN